MISYKIVCYKIWWSDKDDLYVGSTKEKLSKRMTKHRGRARDGKLDRKIYNAIRTNGYDFKYCKLESYDVFNNEDKLKWEQYWIDELTPNLNMNRAHNFDGYEKGYNAKHYEKNKIKILVKKKEWNENNKDIVSAKNKANHIKGRNIQTCDCGVVFDHGRKSDVVRHKKSKKHLAYEQTLINPEYDPIQIRKDRKKETMRLWREKNKNHVQEYNKNYTVIDKTAKDKRYYENNKATISSKQKQYYENNKIEILVKRKEYAENNKEAKRKYDVKYRAKNRQKIQAAKKVIQCDCGGTYQSSKSTAERHFKTKIHLEETLLNISAELFC